jgi:hypothetical protein
MKRVILLFITFYFPVMVSGAEYNGVTLDGNEYSCTAFSNDTGNYYNVVAEFNSDQVIITFSNGGYRTLSMDDEEIDDPSDISASDEENGVYWDLDCSDDIN